jgi:hypothetical protein
MAQNGFIYENNASAVLKTYGISTGITAGASHDKPDLELIHPIKKTSSGCELKISPTAAGSLVLKYYKGKWGFGDYKDDPEKIFLYDLGKKYKLLAILNKEWGGSKVPYLQNDISGKKVLPKGISKDQAYKKDLAQFGGSNEVKINIPAKGISDYYNTKHCEYINVGTHGFFLLNKIDPFKLNEKLVQMNAPVIPDFSNSTNAGIRCRCQYKGSGDYQFVMTLQFSGTKKSPYNIAPIMSSTNVAINKKSLDTGNNSTLLAAFRK